LKKKISIVVSQYKNISFMSGVVLDTRETKLYIWRNLKIITATGIYFT